MPLSRRRCLLGGGALLASTAVLAWAAPLRAAAQPAQRRERRPLMGTMVGIAAVGDDALLGPALDAAYAEMARQAALMSHYAATSAVGAINLAAGLQPVPVPPELMRVLRMAEAVSRRSDGAFDVTVGSVGRWHFDPLAPAMPSRERIAGGLRHVDWRALKLDGRAGTAMLARRGMALDTGGIAKLPILQAGLLTLEKHGIDTALIDGGGDVLARAAAGARPWQVGIRDPRSPEKLAGRIALTNGVLASSGDYERCFVRDGRRYHHVLDPRTGYPTRGLHGVTLLADSVEAVNGIGTALMVMPADAGLALVRADGLDALLGGRDGSLRLTGRLERHLSAA